MLLYTALYTLYNLKNVYYINILFTISYKDTCLTHNSQEGDAVPL